MENAQDQTVNPQNAGGSSAPAATDNAATTPAPGAESNTKAFSGSFSADLDFNLGANGTNPLKTNVEIGYDKVKIKNHKQVVSLMVSERKNKSGTTEELTPFLALATATDVTDDKTPTQNFYAHVEYPGKIQVGTQVTISNIQLLITYADKNFVQEMNSIDKTTKRALPQAQN
jgi:hypothetical protein